MLRPKPKLSILADSVISVKQADSDLLDMTHSLSGTSSASRGTQQLKKPEYVKSSIGIDSTLVYSLN